MGWLDFLLNKQSEKREFRAQEKMQDYDFLSEGRSTTDHLGLAAAAKHSARQAVREKRFDDAWRLFHEQKSHFAQHAKSYGHTPRQTLALDGSVHEDLANIRRLEKKHEDALVHLLYCICTSTNTTQAQQKKIGVYVTRCKFPSTSLGDAEAFIAANRKNPDFRSIQKAVAKWQS